MGSTGFWITSWYSRRRISGTVKGSRSAARSTRSSPPDGRLAQDGQIGQSEHRQGDVSVPADPGADLVLVEPDLALGRLEAFLNRPARARHPHEIGQCRSGRGRGEIERQLVFLTQAAPDQQPLSPALRHAAAEGQEGPVIQPRAPAPALSRCQPSAGTSSTQSSTGTRPRCWALVTAST